MIKAGAVLFVGCGLFMNSVTLCHMPPQSFAEDVGAPGAWLLSWSPWVFVGMYVVAVFWAYRVESLARQCVVWMVCTAAAVLFFGYSVEMVREELREVVLEGEEDWKLEQHFEAEFGVEAACYGGNEGLVLVVRESDYREEMEEFVSVPRSRVKENSEGGEQLEP